jgi:hypothetical protein
MPIAPAPIYVVNQGPEYAGPGIMIPYRTWSPAAAYAPAAGYPYVPGYHHGYGYRYGHRHHGPGPRFAYRERVYAHPHHYPVRYWHSYPQRPLGVRG